MISAKTIMTENVVTIKENASLEDAAKLMMNKHVKSLLVTKNSSPVSIITQKDILKGALMKSKRINKVTVKQIMSQNFLAITPDTNYSFVIRKLKEDGIKKFPVVENNRLVGIITETDIVDATRDFTRFHHIMQEVILAVFGIVTAFFLFLFSPLGQSILNR